MKLRNFIIVGFLVAVLWSVLHWLLRPASLELWSVLSVLYVVLPFFIAWAVEKVGIKEFYKEYLSLKETKWKVSVRYIVLTAIMYPLAALLMNFVLGLFGTDSYIATGMVSVLGIFDMNVGTVPSYICALLINIVAVMIAGSLLGAVNCIFEEAAWRGFLKKYLKLSCFIKPVVIGLIWTLWMLPLRHSFEVGAMIWLAIQNIVLSYYLGKVASDTKSVWTGAMVRGILNLAYVIPLFGFVLEIAVPSVIVTVLSVLIVDRVLIRRQ